jgi:hypothetical protein
MRGGVVHSSQSQRTILVYVNVTVAKKDAAYLSRAVWSMRGMDQGNDEAEKSTASKVV